jgi:prolyl oligopeptidase
MGPRPVILRIDEEGGHGAGSTEERLRALLADLFAFAIAATDEPESP